MREGPVQTEAPQPLGAQLTIRRVISEVGPAPGSSGVSQGRASLRSGISPTEVGDARIFLIFSAGRGATSHRRQGLVLLDRKSTRLNSSHVAISYAVFCLKKKIYTI